MTTVIDNHINVTNIPISQLHADFTFNCRGPVEPRDVIELISSIKEQGLLLPLMVQAYSEEKILETGFKYRIIAGYRRYVAIQKLGYQEIPCIIKYGLDEAKARILNLVENVERENLNILQEAKALARLKMFGMTQDDVAKQLKKSRGWVQVRYSVLEFPDDIQEVIAEGHLNQNEIKQIYSLPLEEQYRQVRRIKDAKQRGVRGVIVKRPVAQESKRARNKTEMSAMLDHIYEYLGPSFTTRTLAWAIGNISSRELFKDISEQAKDRGKVYIMPEEELT